MPDPTPPRPSVRAHLLAAAWKILRAAVIASFLIQVASSIELIVSSVPEERLGKVLFSIGWLALVGIVAYGVTLRHRWALWLAGGYSALSLPYFIAFQIVPRVSRVVILGVPVEGITPASTVIDLLSLIASGVLIYGLVKLRQAQRT